MIAYAHVADSIFVFVSCCVHRQLCQPTLRVPAALLTAPSTPLILFGTQGWRWRVSVAQRSCPLCLPHIDNALAPAEVSGRGNG